MSDLQCPARLLITRAAEGAQPLGEAGREQARVLAGALAALRPGKVYCSEAPVAVEAAETVAAVLGVPVEAIDGLRGAAAGESADDVLRRAAAELGAIADQHRGESVLVLTDAGLISLAVPLLARNLPAGFGRDAALSPVRVTEVDVDADGWLVRSWDGRPVGLRRRDGARRRQANWSR